MSRTAAVVTKMGRINIIVLVSILHTITRIVKCHHQDSQVLASKYIPGFANQSGLLVSRYAQNALQLSLFGQVSFIDTSSMLLPSHWRL